MGVIMPYFKQRYVTVICDICGKKEDICIDENRESNSVLKEVQFVRDLTDVGWYITHDKVLCRKHNSED